VLCPAEVMASAHSDERGAARRRVAPRTRRRTMQAGGGAERGQTLGRQESRQSAGAQGERERESEREREREREGERERERERQDRASSS